MILCRFPAPAAPETGSLSGTIFDSGGKPVPLATITLANSSGRRSSSMSNASGRYYLPDLAPGSYTVTVAAAEFGVRSFEVTIREGGTTEFPIALTIPAGTLDRPLGMTSYLDALRDNAEIAPGQEGGDIAGYGPFGSRGNMSLDSAGQRAEDNNFTVDAIDNNENWVRSSVLLPPRDAIASVSLAQGYIPAEFTHETGAGVSVETRSGSNAFHGGIFENFQNSALDARNFFDGPQPGLTGNDFGASAGGALRRDDWFYFAAFEASRARQGLTILSTVPTAAEKTGAFGNIAVFDPLTLASAATGYTRQQFSGNQIPASRIPQAAFNLINLYPDPNLPGLADNYRFTPPQIDNDARVDLRSDKMLPRGKLLVRVSGERFDLQSPGALPLTGGGYAGSDLTQFADDATTKTTAWGAAVGYTVALHPQLINETHFGAAGILLDSAAADRGINASDLTGIPGLGFDGLPSVSPAGFTSLGAAQPAPFGIRSTNAELRNTVSWIRGRHSWKFGGQIIRRDTNGTATEWTDRGTFFFTPDYTGIPGTALGDSVASLLLGFPTEARRDVLFDPFRLRAWEWSGFAQDQIQISRRLTIQAGLTDSLFPPLTEQNNRMVNFNFSIGSPALNQFAGQNGVNGYAGAQYLKHAVAPRVGFAFELNSRTILRGGFSQNYDAGAAIAEGILARNPPYAALQDFINGTLDVGPNISSGLPAPASLSLVNASLLNSVHGSIYAIQPQRYTPYADQWTLFVERRLRPRLALEIGGTGSMGIHLYSTYNPNQPLPNADIGNPERYPFKPYTSRVEYLGMGGGSTYYGGQVRLTGEVARGLQVSMSYVYSKEEDDAIAPFTNPESRPDGFQNIFNAHARGNRSDSPYDLTHRAVLAAHYDLPYPASAQSWTSALFGGWSLSTLATLQTGFPFTPELAVNGLNNGGFQLPNRVGNGTLPSGARSYMQWFNTSLEASSPFQVPALFQYGTSGFDILHGPGLESVDASLARTFRLRENLRLQFRVEARNLLNNVNFALPDRLLGVESSGVISHTVTTARQTQALARLIW